MKHTTAGPPTKGVRAGGRRPVGGLLPPPIGHVRATVGPLRVVPLPPLAHRPVLGETGVPHLGDPRALIAETQEPVRATPHGVEGNGRPPRLALQGMPPQLGVVEPKPPVKGVVIVRPPLPLGHDDVAVLRRPLLLRAVLTGVGRALDLDPRSCEAAPSATEGGRRPTFGSAAVAPPAPRAPRPASRAVSPTPSPSGAAVRGGRSRPVAALATPAGPLRAPGAALGATQTPATRVCTARAPSETSAAGPTVATSTAAARSPYPAVATAGGATRGAAPAPRPRSTPAAAAARLGAPTPSGAVAVRAGTRGAAGCRAGYAANAAGEGQPASCGGSAPGPCRASTSGRWALAATAGTPPTGASRGGPAQGSAGPPTAKTASVVAT